MPLNKGGLILINTTSNGNLTDENAKIETYEDLNSLINKTLKSPNQFFSETLKILKKNLNISQRTYSYYHINKENNLNNDILLAYLNFKTVDTLLDIAKIRNNFPIHFKKIKNTNESFSELFNNISNFLIDRLEPKYKSLYESMKKDIINHENKSFFSDISDEKLLIQLAEKTRDSLKDRRLTQAELAHMAGISKYAVYRIVNIKNRSLNAQVLKNATKIANVFGFNTLDDYLCTSKLISPVQTLDESNSIMCELLSNNADAATTIKNIYKLYTNDSSEFKEYIQLSNKFFESYFKKK